MGRGRRKVRCCNLAVQSGLPPAKIQLNLSTSLFGVVKGESGKTLHRAPVGPDRKDLPTSSSLLNDATDDLIPFYPLDPPNVSVNIVYIELKSGHDAVQTVLWIAVHWQDFI